VPVLGLPGYAFALSLFAIWAALMLLYYRGPLRQEPKHPFARGRGSRRADLTRRHATFGEG
jgi:uncharacterized BrkB/YihY/UPF0761 family membrane protein